MLYYFIALLFLFGLMLGSFLSVVVGRLETGETVIFGRSKCPKCKKVIKGYDLVPVFSFIFLKGRCRHCQEKISLFYPFIEIITGTLFALLFWRFFGSFTDTNLYIFLFLHLFVIANLVVVFFYDWFYYIIPDKIVFPTLSMLVVFALIDIFLRSSSGFDFLSYSNVNIWPLLLGVIIGGGFFLILVLLSKEKWMGWGDVKLGLLLGVLLGFPNILVALFFAFVTGSIYSLALIGMKKKKMKDIIPFGPFLVIGGIIALFLGKWLINWYLGV